VGAAAGILFAPEKGRGTHATALRRRYAKEVSNWAAPRSRIWWTRLLQKWRN